MGQLRTRTVLVVVFVVALLLGSATPLQPSVVTVYVNKNNPYHGKTPASAKRLAKVMVQVKGWHTGKQWRCLARLWGKESAWNWRADNPDSSAYGIPQILGLPTSFSPRKQIYRGVKYISHKYENPCRAWSHWRKHNWY